MKIAIIGAGAMGALFGSFLYATNEVLVLDNSQTLIRIIQEQGVQVSDADGKSRTVPLRATSSPDEIGPVDLVIILVKSYHTASAANDARALLDSNTVVLTLQNGWGNTTTLQNILGPDRVLAGLTYNSATTLAPGHVQHTARGRTVIGELDGTFSERLEAVRATFDAAGITVEATTQITAEIWAKLGQTVCSLPTSALLGFRAGELMQHSGTVEIMRALLRELVDVAQSQGIAIDFEERWAAISGGLTRAGGAKASMLQDIEARRRTEIDVINGAVVAAGQRVNIATPYNNAMVWLVRSLEESFASPV
jgi:2-dehydropantoate 2-reductase